VLSDARLINSEMLNALFGGWFLLLVDSILSALDGIDPQLPPQEQVARGVENNVRWTVRTILESPEGRMRLAEGRMKCAGAIYEIETGRVRVLDADANSRKPNR
jgi:carbonic anhydrase